jgi:hypothetical protein
VSSNRISRRRVLRGIMGGAVITVGLPFLDRDFNANATALVNGSALPVCFGSWFQGLGFNPGCWEPKISGAKYDMMPALAALSAFKDKINIYSGLQAYLDGKPNQVHVTGPEVCLTGTVPEGGVASAPTIDSLVADVIGTGTRFRSLEVSCFGGTQSYSRRSASAVNPSEESPVALFTRIFGSGFKDPNSAHFAPDPQVIARRSVLSAVEEHRRELVQQVGASDRARLDEYFTSLRGLEQQLDLSLQKPAPLASCSVPAAPEEHTPGVLIDDVLANHRLFAGLLAHALACGQTRVFNVNLGGSASTIRKPGDSSTFHTLTHEEGTDPKLGYQPTVAWFMGRVAEAYRDMLLALSSIREGDGTLLDRCIVLYSTDTGNARYHSMDNIPMMTAGGANGRLRTGIHMPAKGDPVTRVGLTVQQALGVPVSHWGNGSNQTSRPFSEVLV